MLHKDYDCKGSVEKKFVMSLKGLGAKMNWLGSTQPPIQWVPGALSPGVKHLEREADRSPPASGKAKKMWIYTSTPPYAFMT
jgi:hypothetical protein